MSTSSPIAFILGAGASAEAGVPTMREIPASFRAVFPLAANEAALFDHLLAALGPRDRAGIVDVELLLASLERALELDRDPSAALLELRSEVHVDLGVARSLSTKLKRYLRQACADPIDPVSVSYLAPLAMFARSQGVLDIVSLNYDCSIEAIADRERVALTDGFRFFWSPGEEFDQRLESDLPVIRLYKLHGSLSWYRRATYEWVKLPIRPSDESGFVYFTGEALSEVMVYPTVEKDPGATPLTDLMLRAKAVLRQAAVIVIIGYSLRDERIREALYEALARSPTTEIVLVDPAAVSLAADWLSDGGARHRIMPISRKAAEALSGNYLHKVTAAILSAQEQIRAAESQKPHLYSQARRTYREAIRSYYGIRHIDAVRAVVEREEATNPEPISSSDQHPLPFVSTCMAFALIDGVMRSLWWRLLVPLLYWLVADRLRNLANLATIGPRAGLPGIASSSANLGFVEDDIAAMQSVLKAVILLDATAEHAEYRDRLASLDQQIDLLLRLGAITYSSEPNKREQLDGLAPEYLNNPSPSELAETLATFELPAPVGLQVDWSGLWPRAVQPADSA
jgi:hypothetical protein